MQHCRPVKRQGRKNDNACIIESSTNLLDDIPQSTGGRNYDIQPPVENAFLFLRAHASDDCSDADKWGWPSARVFRFTESFGY